MHSPDRFIVFADLRPCVMDLEIKVKFWELPSHQVYFDDFKIIYYVLSIIQQMK